MKEKWNAYRQRFEAFELRERALIIGALVAVVYLLWDFLLLQPVGEATKVALAQERIAKQNITTSEAELTVLGTLASRDPDAQIKQELKQLQQKLQTLDTQLQSLSVGLIKASELPVMLQQMLAQTQDLQLVSLATLPVETVRLRTNESVPVPEAAPTKETAAQVVQLFKHSVQVKLRGSYGATYRFIKSLEDSSWQFYWDSFDYQTKEYPNALITLRIFTLAGDKGMFDGDLGAP